MHLIRERNCSDLLVLPILSRKAGALDTSPPSHARIRCPKYTVAAHHSSSSRSVPSSCRNPALILHPHSTLPQDSIHPLDRLQKANLSNLDPNTQQLQLIQRRAYHRFPSTLRILRVQKDTPQSLFPIVDLFLQRVLRCLRVDKAEVKETGSQGEVLERGRERYAAGE